MVRWARRRSKAEPGVGSRKQQNATCTWKARSSDGLALAMSSRRRVSPVSVMPYNLAVALLVAAAGLRLARHRFTLVAQGRPLTADGAGHRAEEPGPGVINRADGAGQLEPVERGVEGAERDAAGPAGELGHSLLQFIAVRLVLLEDPEDRYLDHEGKSIGSIYRAATI